MNGYECGEALLTWLLLRMTEEKHEKSQIRIGGTLAEI
jgi:hypothetical protein